MMSVVHWKFNYPETKAIEATATVSYIFMMTDVQLINKMSIIECISNLHWMIGSKMQDAGKVMIWYEILEQHDCWVIFLDGNLNANQNLDLLKTDVFTSTLNENGDFHPFFKQGIAPPQYSIEMLICHRRLISVIKLVVVYLH